MKITVSLLFVLFSALSLVSGSVVAESWQKDRWSDVPQRSYREQQRARSSEQQDSYQESAVQSAERRDYRPAPTLAPARVSGYESTYLLGAGDKLSINVFGEEDLSVEEVRLNDSGSISYPFLGEITAAGRTVGQLQEVIRLGLMDGYLMDPKVNVTILEYREFFIYGEVEEPGGYPFQPGLTVRKAVAIAGGFTERASESKIFVIPENAPPSYEPSNIAVNGLINPGDTITIKQRFF